MTARGRERSARARAGGECRVSAPFSGFSRGFSRPRGEASDGGAQRKTYIQRAKRLRTENRELRAREKGTGTRG